MAGVAKWLKVSGFGGIVAGMFIGLYQVLLHDPMLLGGARGVPSWMVSAHVHFFGLSLIVLFYGFTIDDLFEGYERAVGGLAVLGQWGLPVVLMVAVGGDVPQLNALQLPLALVNVAVAIAFLVNAVRRW